MMRIYLEYRHSQNNSNQQDIIKILIILIAKLACGHFPPVVKLKRDENMKPYKYTFLWRGW